MNDNLKVYINKIHNGNLSFEDDKYIFNYNTKDKEIRNFLKTLKECWCENI
jgi:hypothetical protein